MDNSNSTLSQVTIIVVDCVSLKRKKTIPIRKRVHGITLCPGNLNWLLNYHSVYTRYTDYNSTCIHLPFNRCVHMHTSLIWSCSIILWSTYSLWHRCRQRVDYWSHWDCWSNCWSSCVHHPGQVQGMASVITTLPCLDQRQWCPSVTAIHWMLLRSGTNWENSHTSKQKLANTLYSIITNY